MSRRSALVEACDPGATWGRPLRPHIIGIPRTLTERGGTECPVVARHLFRTGPAVARAEHHHRVHLRGRPPLLLHDAHRLWLARSGCGDPGSAGRMGTISARPPRRRGARRLARRPQCALSARCIEQSVRASRSPTYKPTPAAPGLASTVGAA